MSRLVFDAAASLYFASMCCVCHHWPLLPMRVRSVLCNGIVVVVAAFWAAGCSTAERMTTPSSIEGPRQGGPSDPVQRPPTSPGAPIAPDTEKCDASKAGSAVGSPPTAEVLERARVAAGASVARFLKPSQPISMEYLASRLNLGLDDENIVRSLRCG